MNTPNEPFPAEDEKLKLPQKEDVQEDKDVQGGGNHWLRYSGIGSGRKAVSDKKISGTEVTSLGSLEAEVMGLLWEIGKPANGMDVAEASLYKRRRQNLEPVAFSTINTTLRRLTEKGLLVSQKSDARTSYYTPTVGREEMAARILNNVSETLLGRSLLNLIPRLIGSVEQRASSSAAEQDKITRLMQALEEAARQPSLEPKPSDDK